MSDVGVLSIIIPLGVIVLAIVTKDVVVSLLSGIFISKVILNDFNIFNAFISILDDIVELFSHGWVTKSVLFALLVGSIIKIVTKAGGVESFIEFADRLKINSKRGSLFLAYFIGLFIFIESSITSLVAGTVAKPLCDKNRVSRAKLAYVCDSTSAPVCSLILFNAWGALILGLIADSINSGVIGGNSLEILIKSIPYNFYAIVTLFTVFLVIYFDIDILSMKRAKVYDYIKVEQKTNRGSVMVMILPILFLVFSVILFLYYTGHGDITKGSGSSSVFYGVSFTLLFIYIYYRVFGYISHSDYFKGLYSGISDMVPIVTILILAFLIGAVIKDLGTANYIAHFLKSINIPKESLPAIVFVVSAITSFATGTSWGTFSIMMPIALALGGGFGVDSALMVASVVSGGVFGDHVSPISDTTVISSMASGCDHIEHVKTQIPYALISASIALLLFLLFGYIS